MDSSYPTTTEHAGKEKGYVWLTNAIVSELEHSPHSCIQLHTRRTFSHWRSMKGKFAEINLLLGVVSATRPTMYVLFAPLSVSMFQCCALIPAVSLVCLSHLSLLTTPPPPVRTEVDSSRRQDSCWERCGTLGARFRLQDSLDRTRRHSSGPQFPTMKAFRSSDFAWLH